MQAANNKKAKASIAITVNGASLDLLTLLGKNAKATAPTVGFKKLIPYGSSANFAYKNGKARIDARGSYQYGLIEGGWIWGPCDYNLAGVAYGMSKGEAEAAITKNGYHYSRSTVYKGITTITYSKAYLNNCIEVDVDYKGDKVVGVIALFCGEFPWDDDGYLGI